MAVAITISFQADQRAGVERLAARVREIAPDPKLQEIVDRALDGQIPELPF